MARSSRHQNPGKANPKNIAAEPNTKQYQTESNKSNLAGPEKIIDTPPAVLESQSNNDIIIVNTDGKPAPQAGDSMLETRTNRTIASLADQAELVSIAIQAYNRLEKTKVCVDCILKYTADFDYELILFDNGSIDGTLEYFKSVKHPRKKIIRVTHNIGATTKHVFNHFSGRYLAYIAGDVYVTKNWLKNLMICMKSEPVIGMVIPASSNSSFQGLDITFDTFNEMQEKAAKNNVSNPDLWHERINLFPLVGLYKREALDLCGLEDSGFFHYLADNDFTFRIRRAGFKIMLCKDTFVHHDHNRADPIQKNPEELKSSMEAGKKDFKKKYFGVDAWEDVNNFETVMMSLVNPLEQKGFTETEILGVDVLCGTPILELKNKLRTAQVYDTRLHAYSTDPKYWLDLNTICAGKVIVDRIEHLNEHFVDQHFNFIVLSIPINAYPNPFLLLQTLLKRLKNEGHLLLKLRNTYDVRALFKTLGAPVNTDTNFTYHMNLEDFLDQIKKIGFIHRKIALEFWNLDEKDHKSLRNAITVAGFNTNMDEIFTRALVRDFVIDVTKQ